MSLRAYGDRCLIVSADDLGLHEDMNIGIQLAHAQGIVTSASVVACGEAFDHALAIIHDYPDLDIGVHLTLVEERPICSPREIPSLVGPDGRLLSSYRMFTARALSGLVRPAEVRRELSAQMERVISAGCRPSHLDSHQHIHLLPPVWGVTRELARRYGIRWIRLSYFGTIIGSWQTVADPFFRLGMNVLSAMRSDNSEEQIHTVGLHLSGRLSEPDLSRIITGLRPGVSELVTHPGITTPALSNRYRWRYDWSTELAALTSPGIVSLLKSCGVVLRRFGDA